MKDLICSAAAVFLLIAVWFAFSVYSDSRIESFAETTDMIIILAENEEWSRCGGEAGLLREQWESYRQKALFFLNTDRLYDIDYSLAKSLKYIEARDVSNSSGELLALHKQFNNLAASEKLSAANIF